MHTSSSGFDCSWRDMMEFMPIAACMFDPDGRIIWYNAAAAQLWGRHPDPERDRWCGFVRKYWPDGSPMQADQSPPALILQGKLMQPGFEAMADRPDGSRVYFIPHLRALHDAQGEIVGGINMLLDITERHQAEEALRDLAARREAMLEAERKRIAQEIHDELGQLLNTLHISNAALRARLEQDQPALCEKADIMAGLIHRTIDVVRNVATSLRPAALDAGIYSGLEWLVRDFSDHTGIACRLLLDEPEPELPEEQAMALFRIAQESLTNVARHAAAHTATVRLGVKDGQLLLEVSDDGKGFDQTMPGRRTSLGLMGMQERARAVCGRVEVSSAPGAGTRVKASLPLAALASPAANVALATGSPAA